MVLLSMSLATEAKTTLSSDSDRNDPAISLDGPKWAKSTSGTWEGTDGVWNKFDKDWNLWTAKK